jgi:hypothetical protein
MIVQDFKPASRERLESYAAREAAQPELGGFEGGAAATGVWIGIAVVCILVIAIYWLFVDPGRIKPGT